MLKSKYPIICAPMNQVYSYNLIAGCAEAGITPGTLYSQIPTSDLERYLSDYQDVGIVISLSAYELMDKDVVRVCSHPGIVGTEILDLVNPNVNTDLGIIKRYQTLKETKKFNFIFKQFKGNDDFIPDYISLMGAGKAGRTPRNYTGIEEQYLEWSKNNPNLKFIVSGGIHKPEQVKYFIDSGVSAIVIGTLFAASEESPISYHAKLRMVEATAANIHMFADTKQHALVFSDQAETEPYHGNHTDSLVEGIATGTSGHLFAGMGLDSIHSIRPIKEIVADLVKFI